MMNIVRTILKQRHTVLAAMVSLMMIGVSTSFCLADDASTSERDLFEAHVRPTLVAHCIKCHGDTKQEGGLRLTTYEDLLKGGDSGPTIVPGKPDESLLVEALRYESYEMPPSGQLESEVAEGIAAWIQAGAAWPAELTLKPTPKITDLDRDWWCYQPMAQPEVPEVNDNGWCRNEIDRFVYRRMTQAGLSPSPEAAPAELARRLHFAVVGLPPTDQTAATIDSSSDWYEQLLDQLLEDSAYGEHQARFWLDLVRYADSDGYNADHSRPEAHHYRDYVIRSFNADKPYDRFVTEQLAGDEVDPGNRDALIATMYLRHWIYEWNQRDVEGQWDNILNDITETTADLFIAQGLKCARCHDHKFDPLLQKDFFRLKAFFTPIQPREDQPIASVEERIAYEKQLKIWEDATLSIRKRLHEIERPVLLKHASREGVDKFTQEIQTMISKRRPERTPYEHQIASLASNQFNIHPEKLAEWLTPEQEAERKKLYEELSTFDHLKPKPLPTIKFVASDVGSTAPPTYIPDAPEKEDIAPGIPTILSSDSLSIPPVPDALQSTGRRSALAKWITDPENPFTARVIVNRIWQQHFGRGLVETSSDFGQLGTPPSHPELLDWLARRFIEEGWSLKKLHQLILSSATYRQSSECPIDSAYLKQDPQNVYLWRMVPHRLSAEEIHDSLLAASGELNSKNRAIYKSVKRNKLDPLLASFDFPDRIQSECKRHGTTTSPQALMLMNNEWVHERAEKMVRKFSSQDTASMLKSVYQHIFFRPPGAEEIQQAEEFCRVYESLTPTPKVPSQTAKLPNGESALVLSPEKPVTVTVPLKSQTPEDERQFTVTGTVLLKSLYPDASVRTIVTDWTGKNSEIGWSVGVTSEKSSYKPRNLILQLISQTGSGAPHYEVIASNLRPELNKPYFFAVTIDLKSTDSSGITFLLQDLSQANSEPQIANVPHTPVDRIWSGRDPQIGARLTHHRWDGLVKEIQVLNGAYTTDKILDQSFSTPLFDVVFDSDEHLGHDRSENERHAFVESADSQLRSAKQVARAALFHALLNSNEMIYVD